MFSALHPTLTDGDFPALPMLQRGEREGGLKKHVALERSYFFTAAAQGKN
jgi:hypothetical protein